MGKHGKRSRQRRSAPSGLKAVLWNGDVERRKSEGVLVRDNKFSVTTEKHSCSQASDPAFSEVSRNSKGATSDIQFHFSAKRAYAQTNFVFPKDSNGKRVPFYFQTRSHKPAEDPASEQTQAPLQSAVSSNVENETIDDILNSNNPSPQQKKKASEAAEGRQSAESVSQQAELEGNSSGLLSALSVEDVVRDKAGCRPRSNSTDGELNLPRRGLCDERAVLEAYRWRPAMYGPLNVPKGCINLGNTCYLNSTLQCLASLPPFCQTLLAVPEYPDHENSGNRKISQGKRITLILRSLFREMHSWDNSAEHRRGAIAPRKIVRAVPSLGSCGSRNGYKFRPGRQEDAHEFLVHLLDAMNDGELRQAGINQHLSGWRDKLPIPRLDETTFVHRVFGGYFRSQVKCTSCGYNSNTYDPFLDLSLEVAAKSCRSLSHALAEFTRKETLDSKNKYKCSGCKKRVCATKQLTVFRPPLSLCIQLKRFAYDGGFGRSGGFGSGKFGGYGGGRKITKPIQFPAEFKLPLSDGRKCGYVLTGTVVHLGNSATSGHYTAFVRRTDNEGARWFHIDDSCVETVEEHTVLQQQNAYILFYSRKEVSLEFPTPPLKKSMSTEQAKAVSRDRALASSMTENDRQPTVFSKSDTINTSEKRAEEKEQTFNAKVEATKDRVAAELSVTEHAQSSNATKRGVLHPASDPPSRGTMDARHLSSVDGDSSDDEDSDGDTGNDKSNDRKGEKAPAIDKKVGVTKDRLTTKSSVLEHLKAEKAGTDHTILEKMDRPSNRTNNKSLVSSSESVTSDEDGSESDSSDEDSSDSDDSIGKSSKTQQGAKNIDDKDEGGAMKDGAIFYTSVVGRTENRKILSSSRPHDRSEASGLLQSAKSEEVGRCGSTKKEQSDQTKPNSFKPNLPAASNGRGAPDDDDKPHVESNCIDSKISQTEASNQTTPGRSLECQNTSNGESKTVCPIMERCENAKISGQRGTKRTKVVLGAGPGRNRIEVMMGPRSRKSWSPKSVTTGNQSELLGNIALERWDSEEDNKKDAAENRATLLRTFQKQERDVKRKMYLDSHDAKLDEGRRKKIKAKKEFDNNFHSHENKFLKIQLGVQALKRGTNFRSQKRRHSSSPHKRHRRRGEQFF